MKERKPREYYTAAVVVNMAVVEGSNQVSIVSPIGINHDVLSILRLHISKSFIICVFFFLLLLLFLIKCQYKSRRAVYHSAYDYYYKMCRISCVHIYYYGRSCSIHLIGLYLNTEGVMVITILCFMAFSIRSFFSIQSY